MKAAHVSSYFDPRKWNLLTWAAMILFIAYSVARNAPASTLNDSVLETRNLSESYVHEVNRFELPRGWPILCIRPINGYHWDSDFKLAKTGSKTPVAKTNFFISVFLVNLAITASNVLAIAYLSCAKIFQYVIGAMLVVTAACSLLFLTDRPQNFDLLWNGADTIIIPICLLPLVVAAPLFYYRYFTDEPYRAPEGGKLSHVRARTTSNRR